VLVESVERSACFFFWGRLVLNRLTEGGASPREAGVETSVSSESEERPSEGFKAGQSCIRSRSGSAGVRLSPSASKAACLKSKGDSGVISAPSHAAKVRPDRV
jgi:hypothetical protein